MSNVIKVLCVGVDPQLLESRRLVLQSAGFEASCCFPQEALELLPVGRFDLMIVSVSVSDEDQAALAAAVPSHTRPIQLHGFMPPQELLKLVRSE